MYPPPPPMQNMSHQPPYGTPGYVWANSPSPGQPPPPPPHVSHQSQHHPQHPGLPPGHPDGHQSTHPGPISPPMHNTPQYPPYSPGPAPYGYGVPGYYQQPYQPGVPMGPPPPPPIPGQMYHPGSMSEYAAPNAGNGNGMDGLNLSRTSSRNSNGHGSVNGKRGAPRARGSWTYGPGVSNGGFTYNANGPPNGMGSSDAYGPRLTTTMRRTSNTSSGSAGARTPADETGSTTVSRVHRSGVCAMFSSLLCVDLWFSSLPLCFLLRTS